MALALFTAAVLFGAAADAVRLRQPRATLLPEIPSDAMTPVPTSGPDVRELLRRASSETTAYIAKDNTCGFLSGFEDSAYTCNNVDALCAVLTFTSSGYIGCCDSTTCGGFHQACIDSEQYFSSTLCNNACQSDTFILKCTLPNAPYCNSVSINGGTSLRVYGFYCNDEAISTMQPLSTTYNGETDGRSFSPLALSDDSTAPGGTANFGGGGGTTTTPPHGGGSTTVPGPSTTTTPSPGPTSTTPSSKTNVGAIAGGTVGGVAAVGILGLLGFFLFRQQRKKVQTQGAVPPPPVSAQQPAPGAPGGPDAAGAAMAQVGTPPPAAYYPDPTKTPEYVAQQQQQPVSPSAYGGSPQLNQQPYYQGQPQQPYPQQQYYAAAPAPDRGESASPLGAQDYSRMSAVSAISPQSTGTAGTAGVVPPGGVPPQVPATIHEAGGNAVGPGQDFNANHHGEMHELA